MRSFSVSDQDDGQRLSRFLEKMVPSLYPSLMHKYLRTKRIKINGKRAESASRLSEGDVVELYINDEFFEKKKKSPGFLSASSKLTVLYQDTNVAVLYKPAGVLSHEDKTDFNDTLINRFLRFLYESGEYDPYSVQSFTPALCNRLDRGTSGIVLAAKTAESLREMNKIIKYRLLEKHYLAIVTSKPPEDGSYTAYLLKNNNNNTVLIFDMPVKKAKIIITDFTTISQKDGLWLIDIKLVTGRTHQIRAHLKHLGCPVLGDGKYGDGHINKQYNINRQALAAYNVEFKLGVYKSEFPVLAYLDEKSFSVDSVWFEESYFS